MILDTNALSALAESDLAVADLIAEEKIVAIPVVVIGEFRFGLNQSRLRDQYELWLKRVLRRARVLEITEETTHFYAEIRVNLKRAGKPIASNDLWIAALCLQHNHPLLSRDLDFDSVTGLTRLGW